MIESKQTIEPVVPETLLARVQSLKEEGWRLAAISAAITAGTLHLLYSFDREYELRTLRMELPAEDAKVPSVSGIYFCAVLYENEMHDLFGLQVQNLVVDFKGNLYQTSVKFPFGAVKVPQQTATSTATAGNTVNPTTQKETSTGTTR